MGELCWEVTAWEARYGSNAVTATGTIVEGFRLLRPLGRGWLGHVFAAQNLDGAQVQALRIVAPELAAQPQVMTQFRRLFEKWRRLKHPNILTPDELIEREQHIMYSMALAQSGSVRQLLQAQAREGQFMDMLVAVDLVRQLAGALAYAHDQNLMHGNLKPENLLLTPARALLGRQAYGVLVSDFGVAELQAFTHGIHDRQIVTTPAYMSPEQCRGVRNETRSDIYTVGVILYELLTNLVPFETKELAEAMDKHLHVAPIPPGQIRVDIPADLEEVVLTCMAKAPEYRYKNAHDLEDALQRVLNGLLPQGPRPTVVLPDIPEPAAPPIEPLRDRLPFPRIQVCDERGHLIRVESLKNPTATLGRAPNNSIVLEHAGVSRHHLGLEITDEESVYITDQGSTNGTTLSGVALGPRERTLWPDGAVLRIEPFWLRLQPPQRVVQQARIGVLVEDNDITLTPGEAITLKVNLANTGKIVDHFRMEVEGVPDEWVHNLYHEIPLNPGTTAETTLRIMVPRESKYHAGVYAVKVMARSRDNNTEYGFAPMKWGVLPFVETRTEFSPQKRSAWRRTHYQLKMVNASNVPITYKPTVTDDEGEVKLLSPLDQIESGASSGSLSNLFNVRAMIASAWLRVREGIGKVRVEGLPEDVTLQPGEQFTEKLNVKLPIRWIAAPRNRILNFNPNPVAGANQSAKLSLLHLPLIPLWALPLVLVLGVLLGLWLMQAPSIVSVSVEPQQPLPGKPFTLNIETQNATRILVKPFNKTLFKGSGPLLIPQGITEPTEVQVIVYGRIKTTQQTRMISPKIPAPVIKQFSVSPQNITVGQRAVVRWDVSNVKEVDIEGLGTVPAQGQQEVPITADTTFRLTAKAGNETVNKTATVKILPAQIEIFTVEPNQVPMGGTVTIHWRVRNAQSVTIDPIGTVDATGQIKRKVTADETISLKAQVGSQTQTRSEQVKILPPKVDFFKVSPSNATVGDTVTIQWKVSNATSVTIDPLGTVGPEGSEVMVVTAPTTFRINAGNGLTNTEESKNVNVSARPPSIGSLSVSPRKPRVGDDVTFSWTTQNAQAAELVGLPDGARSLPPNGSTTFKAPASSVTLTLNAKGADGANDSQSIPLPVLPALIPTPPRPPVAQPAPVQQPVSRPTPAQTPTTTPRPTTQTTRPATQPSTNRPTTSPNTTPNTNTSRPNAQPTRPSTPTVIAGGGSGRPSTQPGSGTTTRPPVTTPATPSTRIVSFRTNRSVATAGQTVTLSWNVTGAKEVKIYADNKPNTPNISTAKNVLSVRPQKTTTYTLVAGNKTQKITVVVRPTPTQVRPPSGPTTPVTIKPPANTTPRPTQPTSRPPISATPPRNQGVNTTRPTTTNASGVHAVPNTTTQPTTRPPITQTPVTQTPTTQASTTPADDVVIPEIELFQVTTGELEVRKGTRITLAWKTSGARSVYLTPGGTQALNGSVNPIIVRNTTFVLEATNNGRKVKKTIVIKVID